eukprot:scaffold231701_cov17-Prasinocladus_malaysianus.AAC.1
MLSSYENFYPYKMPGRSRMYGISNLFTGIYSTAVLVRYQFIEPIDRAAARSRISTRTRSCVVALLSR